MNVEHRKIVDFIVVVADVDGKCMLTIVATLDWTRNYCVFFLPESKVVVGWSPPGLKPFYNTAIIIVIIVCGLKMNVHWYGRRRMQTKPYIQNEPFSSSCAYCLQCVYRCMTNCLYLSNIMQTHAIQTTIVSIWNNNTLAQKSKRKQKKNRYMIDLFKLIRQL